MYIDCWFDNKKINKIADENFIVNELSEEVTSLLKYSLLKQGVEDLQLYSDCILSKENKYLLSKIVHESIFK